MVSEAKGAHEKFETSIVDIPDVDTAAPLKIQGLKVWEH